MPRVPRRRSQWCAVLACVLVLAASCDSGPEPTATAASPSPTATGDTVEGATLRWAVREPTGIVPSVAVDATSLLVVDTLFDSLTELGPDGKVHPRAATAWEAFNDGRRWRFTLRAGARYHDGTEVTAEDFVRAWSMTVDQGRTGGHLQDVVGYRSVREGRSRTMSGVRAIDKHTLEVRLHRPNMDLPAIVAHPSLGPVPPSALDDTTGFTEHPVGNGPYRMAEPWAHGQFIRVERASDWHNGPRTLSRTGVREIVFRIIDTDAAYVAFQQGRIDVAPVPAGALAQAREAYGESPDGTGPGLVNGPEPTLYFLGMNVEEPPWDDPEVRIALSRAIDRRALVDADPDRQLLPAHRLVPSWMPGAGPVTCDACLHLPSLARAVFRRAGVTDITLTYDEGGGHDVVMEHIRDQLEDVGVDVTLRSLPFEDYLAALADGDLALYRFGWQAQYGTPGAMLEPLLRSGAPREAGDGANYGNYTDDRVDELLDDARSAAAFHERQEAWTRAEQIALDELPVIPLFTYRQRSVVSERVADLTLTPWGTATPERAHVVADPEIVP